MASQKYCKQCKNYKDVEDFIEPEKSREWKMCNRCRTITRETRRMKKAEEIGMEYKPDESVKSLLAPKPKGFRKGQYLKGSTARTLNPQILAEYVSDKQSHDGNINGSFIINGRRVEFSVSIKTISDHQSSDEESE